MTETTADDRVKVREGAAVWREVEGETVLLALDTSMYIGLNRTGTELWPMMVRGTTYGAMTEHLMATFDVEARRAADDVAAFVERCRQRRLLVD